MENKKVDDPGALALRRLVRGPTSRRLASRRSSIVVSSSSSSSSSSSNSNNNSNNNSSSSSASSVTLLVDGEMPTSCVTRNTSSDECALYRFIVWAAVKRNACRKMTSEERRECPLLRCRKRFPNHELMLQHLYSCDHLAGGEYWCYDCEKPEQLSDVNCKRCLGHPSKRRKIMTMAKSFFSSLGHKPKSHSSALPASVGMGVGVGVGVGVGEDQGEGEGEGEGEGDGDGDGQGQGQDQGGGGEDEPPSYDSVLFAPPPPPPQAELFSTEIHEIGSSEVLLPTIPECETETEPIPAPGMIPCLAPSTFPISPPGSHPGTVPLPSTMEADFINWRPSPPSPQTVAPQSLMKPSSAARLVDRPTLQVITHLDQFRGQGTRRSKVLAPSSSVRSTSSTDSAASTDSTASYNISPMSGWSSGWTKTSGFESALTSPDDLVSPQSLLPAGPFSTTAVTTNTADCTTSTRPIPFGNLEFENMVANSCPSELAADVPMFDDLPAAAMDPRKTQASMGLDQSPFSFNPNVPFQLPLESRMPSTNRVHLGLAPSLPLSPSPPPPLLPPLPPPLSPPPPQQIIGTSNIEPSLMRAAASSSRLTTTTQSLARSVQDALRMHVAESRSKLNAINENPLLMQLNQMPLASVAAVGLETMSDILQGRQASSPLKLVCFVHVVFSLSLVIHEQDASKHSAALFKQALLYSDWFSDDDKIPFIEVVYTLWKPSQVNDDEIITLLKSRPPIPGAGTSKGKQPERFPQGLRSDPLVLIAAYFLDELEYMAISDSSYTGQVSELAMQHHKDGLGASHNSPFAIAARFMIDNIFSHQYSHFPGFELGMEKLIDRINSGDVGTVRRLELELMQAGRTYLPPETFFDDYVEVVRRQTDSLYTQSPYFSSRLTYHRCGIQLLMRESDRSTAVIVESGVESTGGPSSGTLQGIAGVVSSGFDSFDFDSMVDLRPDDGLDAGAPLREAAGWTGEDSAYATAQGNAGITTTPAGLGALDADVAVPMTEDDSLISPTSSTANKAEASTSSTKVESDSCCKICGYRPKGDPRWFMGSMAKHMKTIHSENPQIFRCPYPGCTSQYSKRADNLRQHQIEKNHFVDDEGKQGRRPRKRKRPSGGGGES